MNRRSFITHSSQATMAGVFAPHTYGSLSDEIMNEKVGYAVIGLGNFANYVIPRIVRCKHSRIVALVSDDREKALDWGRKYGIRKEQLYGYQDFDKIEQDPGIDVNYIATPVGTHADFALKSFAAGKHVLTEKTMAASVDEAMEMIEGAKKAKRKLMVAYRARYEPYNQEVIKYGNEGAYGKLSSITAHKGFNIGERLGKDRWRAQKALAGGGALMDIGIYSIQACRYLAGSEPLEVSGFSFSTPNDARFEEVEENLSFMMRFKDGLLATGSASWNYSLQNYFRVGAEKGYYQLEPATSNGRLRLTTKEVDPTFIGERFFTDIDQISAEFDHFSQCILLNSEPLTNGEEGLKDLKVIEAIYRSAQEGRVVRLDQ